LFEDINDNVKEFIEEKKSHKEKDNHKEDQEYEYELKDNKSKFVISNNMLCINVHTYYIMV